MKRTLIVGFLGVALCALSLAAEPRKLFIAFAMTKAQQASSLPTDSGVFLQGDRAGEWKRLGPVIQAMNSLAVDPSNPRTMFLACGNGIARSLDGGDSWRMVTGWRESDFVRISIDPENGDNVYAASVWGLSVSRDGGESWKAANEGLAKTYCRSVVVDSRDPKRVLLGTDDGIYVSRNRAESWLPIRSSPKCNILQLVRSRSDLDLWIAGTEGKGVFVSRNDGKTWESASERFSDKNVYGVALHSTSTDLMAVGGWGMGVWLSNDQGKSWMDRSQGLPSLNVTATAFDPDEGQRVWVSTFEEGTYYSDDFGRTWKDGNLYGAYVLDLGSVPTSE